MSNLLPLRGVSLNLETAVPGGTVPGVRGLSAASAHRAQLAEHVAAHADARVRAGVRARAPAENVAEGGAGLRRGRRPTAAALVDGA